MTEKLRPILKLLSLKLITNYKNIFSKGYTEHWSIEIFIIDSVLKTNPWTFKIKDLNGEKITEIFYKKELLLSISQMCYYPEPDSNIRDKVYVVSDLLNHATKRN